MMFRKALLAATVLALPAAAIAQPVDGLYIAGGIGANYLANTKASDSFIMGGVHTTLHGTAHSPKIGIDGAASVGYGYGNGFRAEAEIVGLANTVKNGGQGGGQEYTYGLMVNGLYDFNIDAPFTPFLGAGVGIVGSQYNGFGGSSAGLAYTVSPKAEYSFAVQGLAGVSVPLTSQLALTAEYRLLDKVQNTNTPGTVTIGGTTANSTFKAGSQLNHSLMLGLRFAFNGAAAAAPAPVAPAAVVAPAPAPARSYLVFFDWDKSDLTARAQQIIADAAKNSTRVAATRIDVAGHADKSGTATYNQSLSLARANKVAAELVRLGVAKSAISISAFGDTKPLVPTAAGVREPQNRRVEIVLH